MFDGRGDDFELEDILSVDLYHAAVVAAYPDQPVDRPPADYAGKRTKHYDRKFREHHGFGFKKRRVAETVRRLIIEGKADAETSENLRKATDAIWDALQRQLAGQAVV